MDSRYNRNDSTRGPARVRVRIARLAALLALFLVAGFIQAVTVTRAAAAAEKAPSGTHETHSPRQGARLAPRKVKPHSKAKAHRAKHKTGVNGEVPSTMRPTRVAKARPSVRGDNVKAPDPKQHTGDASAAAKAQAPNGNWENQLAFTAATLANTGCCDPPDTQLAVGRDYVLEAVNNNGLIYDRGGILQNNFPFTDLFQPPGQSVGLTDPKVVFDPSAGTSGRFYLTIMVCQNATCGANNYTHMGISLAVSNSDDPRGSWSVYDYLNDGQNLQDQPKLGFSGDKVTFAVNEYNCKCGAGTMFLQENIVVLQKSDLVAGNTVTPVVDSQNSFASFIFDSMPTTPVNASTADNTQYVVWNAELASNNMMGVVRITGTPNAGNVSFSNVQTPAIADTTAPPAGVQPGSCLDGMGNPIPCTVAGDKTNFQSAMVQGDDLWAVGTDGCTPANDNTVRACTRLVQVNLAGGGSSIVTDTDVGTQGTYRYNPAVMKDAAGHLFFGFTISSATEFPTAAVDASTLPLPQTLSRTNYATGDATYTGSRWGDYSAMAQDPRDTSAVWAGQEFGACAAACSSGGGNWATAIGQFTFDSPHIDSVSPASGPATGGTTVDIFGSDFANGVNSNTAVSFGPTPAQSVTFVDAGHIKAVSPPGAVGTVDITATTRNGTSDITAGDKFTYTAVADLAVTKTCQPSTTTPAGQTTSCDVFVDNIGPSDAQAVALTDKLTGTTPFTVTTVTVNAGTCLPSTPTPAVATVTISCDLGTEPAAGRTTVHVEMVATEAGTISDTATITSSTPDQTPGNNTATGQVSYTALADLSVTKSALPDPVIAGESLTYRLTATNHGPSTAAGVVLRDSIPAGVSVLSVSPPTGVTCTGGAPGNAGDPLRCPLGTLAPNATAVVTVAVRVASNATDGSQLANQTSVASDTPDNNPGNNQASRTVTVRTRADLAITKTADRSTYGTLQPVTWTITVRNTGPSDARTVVVTDQLPSALTYLSNTGGCTRSQQTLTCNLAIIAAGASKQFTIRERTGIVIGPRTVTNTASVTSTTTDPATGNNTATAQITVRLLP